MIEETERQVVLAPAIRTFSEVVKGGLNPVKESEIEDDEFSSPKEEGDSLEEDEEKPEKGHNRRTLEKSQQPDIRVKKVDGIVNFILNEAALKALRHPWWDTLIVKLLGRKISLPVLSRRLEIMWEKQRSIEVINIAIRPWKPNFNPIEATVDTIATWVRLLGLAIEYYDEEILKKIGNVIGQTMKVDVNTADKSRRKFARICVQLDLTTPLVAQCSINGVKYGVEYEGLYNICFACGMVGHEQNNCPKKITTEVTRKGPQQAAMEEGTRAKKSRSENDGQDKGNTEMAQKKRVKI
ncbi:uncharacterized protein LOC127742780 [Arachis duranensis]|uniref:Uncharacterized protein LOC127742780 n=1 Tax=Arachis duranensis TaxID=130453 RepID=A0A9C6TNB1_ARADU|nr:uncharacterized protein LOC127742780 [Arachis duranensis]